MKILAYYKLLSVCSENKPAQYMVHLIDAPRDTRFTLILHANSLCTVHDNYGELDYDEFINVQGDIYECLEWCLEWYKETFIDDLVNYFSIVDDMGYRRCGSYDVFIHKMGDFWDLAINKADSNEVLLVRHKFSYAGQAIDAAARWIWNTKYYSFPITAELINTFVTELAAKVMEVWSDAPECKLLSNTAGNSYYAARWYNSTTSNIPSGWMYEYAHLQQPSRQGTRIHKTPVKIALRIARDITYNEREHEFGFSSFWEWLKNGVL